MNINKMKIIASGKIFYAPLLKIKGGGEVVYVVESISDTTKLHQSVEDIHNLLSETIISLSKTLEKRDPYTAGHQTRTSELVVAIAKELGFSNQEIELLDMATRLHDIGKIKVPAEILSSPAKLSDEEYALIKQHPSVGYEIVKNIPFSEDLANMIYQHHESLDGSGYPDGLKNGEILLGAKIIKVADTVEAMQSHRPYRASLGVKAALEEIEKNKGILYEASIVDICIKLFKEKNFQFSAIN